MRPVSLLVGLCSGLVCLSACTSAPCITQPPVLPAVPPPRIAEPGDIPGDPVVEVAGYEDALVAALHHFAASGEVGYATALLEKHPKLAGQRCLRPPLRKPRYDDGYLAIHLAARNGHARMVQLLLDRGEKADADGGEGWTPVHVAAKHNRLNVLRVLDRAGADLNAPTHNVPPQPVIGRFGPGEVLVERTPAMSPLDIAKRFRSEAAIQYLERRGMAPSSPDSCR